MFRCCADASSSMGESVHNSNGGQQQQPQPHSQQQQQQQAHQQQQRLRGVTNGDVGTLRPGRLAQPQQQQHQQQPAAISSSSALATNGGDSAGGELGSAASSSSQPHSAAHSTHSSGLVLSAPTSLQQSSLAAPQSQQQQPPHSTAKTDQTGTFALLFFFLSIIQKIKNKQIKRPSMPATKLELRTGGLVSLERESFLPFFFLFNPPLQQPSFLPMTAISSELPL